MTDKLIMITIEELIIQIHLYMIIILMVLMNKIHQQLKIYQFQILNLKNIKIKKKIENYF